MPYPYTLTRIYDNLELYVPDPVLVKSGYEKLLAADPLTPFPFWAKIWPSAYELASFLREQPCLTVGKQVMELGGGIGLPSFAVAELAAGIVISDQNADAVELMKKNIALHSLANVKAKRIDWNQYSETQNPDLLLLSDVNYDAGEFNSLLILIRRFIEQGRCVILSTPQRININPFAEALFPFIKRSTLRGHSQAGTEVAIRILELSK